MEDLSQVIQQIIPLVERAGQEVMKLYGRDYNIKDKGGDNPVTTADLESNRIITAGLKPFGWPVLSEESKDDPARLQASRVWVVDPLDGTKDFIGQTGEFTIMIALTENARPILGLVSVPAQGILYYGLRGQGAWLVQGQKKEKLAVSAVHDLSAATMLSSRYHRSDLERDFAAKHNIKKFISRGSSLKLVEIASGQAELNINPYYKMKEVDLCAADIILHQAGGRLTDLSGRTIEYNRPDPEKINGYIASNGLLHDKVLKLIDLIK